MYILTCVRGETLADNISLHQAIEFGIGKASGEVPKMAEGTPLERVQVVNSGARVQIPLSPLDAVLHFILCFFMRFLKNLSIGIDKEIQKLNKKVLDKLMQA